MMIFNLFTPAFMTSSFAEDINDEGIVVEEDIEVDSYSALSSDFTVSGTIYLPDGDVAPDYGMYVELTCIKYFEDNTWSSWYLGSVWIEGGSNSADYNFVIDNFNDGSRYTIEYNYYGYYNEDSKYYRKGYYNQLGTVVKMVEATSFELSSRDISGIDIRLIPTTTLSGAISLPNGDVAPMGGLYISVGAAILDLDPTWNHGTWDWIRYDYIYIEEGESSARYEIKVPGVVGAEYMVQYQLQTYREDYKSMGYYNASKTVTEASEITLIDSSISDITGINMTIIPFSSVSGNIYLPNGEVAPEGGIYINLSIGKKDSNGYWQNVAWGHARIEEGMNAVSYKINLPDTFALGEYTISYNIYRADDYYREGFYNETATTSNLDKATFIQLSDEGIDGIDLTVIPNVKLSGEIYLPNDMIAPEGGIGVNLSLVKKLNENNWQGISNTTRVIEAGSNATFYNLSIPADEMDSEYILQYYLTNEPVGFINKGFYNVQGTVSRQEQSTIIIPSINDNNNVDINLLEGKVLSGTISLPNGETAPTGGMNIAVYAGTETKTTDKHSKYFSYSTSICIQEGQNSATYNITVPWESTPVAYKINYSFWNNEGTRYISQGYYNSNGTVDGFNLCEEVLVYDDIANLDMTILKGVAISGKVVLPNGGAIPSSGFSINIRAIKYELGELKGEATHKSVYVEPGKSFANYEIIVPGNHLGSDYIIEYAIHNEQSPYVSKGYYSEMGIVDRVDLATIVKIVDSDVFGIDLPLQSGIPVSGIVSLPNGELAPEGGIYVGVEVSSKNSSNRWQVVANKGVHIQGGTNSSRFNISLPEVGEYIFSYQFWVNPDELKKIKYLDRGYYNVQGTVLHQNEASIVHLVAAGISDINISLVPADIVSGSISLPEGEVAPAGGMSINLNSWVTDGYNMKPIGHSYTYIPQGYSSADYVLKIPSNDNTLEYVVEYYYHGNEVKYISGGYYSEGGTVPYSSLATRLIASNDNISNINMTLLEGISISGTISLPNDAVAPIGGIKGSISANELIDLGSHSRWEGKGNYIEIPEGSNSIPFRITVPKYQEAKAFKVGYFLHDSLPGYLNKGYYSDTGTVTDIILGSDILVSQADISDINFSIIDIENLPDDHSDTIEGATIIALNTSINGIVDYAGDIDFFKLDITERAMVNIYTSGNIDTYGHLLDSNGAEISKDDQSGSGNNFRITADLDPGTYFIKVRHYSTGTGQYTLHVKELGDIVQIGTPILASLTDQRNTAWHDGIITLEEIQNNGLNIPVDIILPEGIGTGRYDSQNGNKLIGYWKFVNIYDKNNQRISSSGWAIQQSELDAGIATQSARFNDIIDKLEYGEKNYIRAEILYYDEDGNLISSSALSAPFEITYPLLKSISYISIENKQEIIDAFVYSYDSYYINDIVLTLKDEKGNVCEPTDRQYIKWTIESGPASIYTRDRWMIIDGAWQNLGPTQVISASYVSTTEPQTAIIRATSITNPEVYDTFEIKIKERPRLNSVSIDSISIPDLGLDDEGQTSITINLNSYNSDIEAYDQYGNEYMYSATGASITWVASEEDNDVVVIEDNVLRPVGIGIANIWAVIKDGMHEVASNKIQVKVVDTITNEDDHSNSMEHATPIDINSSTEGAIDYRGDVDWFKFELHESSIVEIYTTGNTDTLGYLVNSQGDIILEDDDSGGNSNFKITKKLDIGTYYIKVREYSSATGDYILHVVTKDGQFLDLNGDDNIDILDLIALLNHYGKRINDKDYDELFDINKDGIVDIYDIVILTKNIEY